MIICPNFNNPDITREFNELKDAVGEKAAYAIWSLNNGNAIDKAPNGAESKLFQDLLQHFNGDRVKAIRAKAKTYGASFMRWFGDWIGANAVYDDEGNRVDEVSKVVDHNGEPLVVYHGTNWDFTVFNKETRGNATGASSAKLAFFAASNFRNAEKYLLSEDRRYVDFINNRGEYDTYDRFDTTVSQNQEDIIAAQYKKEQELWKQPLFQIDELKNHYGEGYILEGLLYDENIKEKYPEAAKKYKEEMQKIEDNMILKYNPHVKAVFLNIKNIRETDDKGAKFSAGSYTETIQKAQKENKDGGVIKNTKDPIYTDVYYFFEPNQIKSIENDGSFTDGDNIYHNLKAKTPSTVNEVANTLENILRDYYSFHRYNGFRETVGKDNKIIRQSDAEKVERAFGFPTGTIKLSDRGTYVTINRRLVSDQLHTFKDRLQHSKVNDALSKIRLVQFLQSKFPQIKGIKFVQSDRWNGMFKDGIVYLNVNTSLDVAAEECLHPFVEALFSENRKLFVKLLEEAQDKFKPLRSEIAVTYSNKRGFTATDRHKELVTQALARHFSDVYEQENHIGKKEQETVWQRAWDWILEKLGISGVKELNKNTTLRQLAQAIFKANNINISDVYFVDEKYNLSQQNEQDQQQPSITRQLYSLGEQIDLKRQQYITAVVDQYKKNNPDAQQNQIAKVYNEARKQFNLQQSDAILRDNQLKLATLFGLHMNVDGYFESSETGQKKLMLEHFINSLQQSTSKTYRLSNISKPKYQQVGHVLNATSFANVIYSALYDGELATLDKQMARDYVRMFWGSDLIQSALDALHTNNQTSQQLEDRLVERMTKEPVQSRPQAVEWFNNIWNRLKDIVKTVFGVHSFTEEQKNDIVNAATAAYMVSQDLEYTENNNVIYDRIDGDYSSSDLLSEQDKKILSNIKLGIQTRIKSQHARSIAKQNQRLIADLKSSLELIDSKNEDSVEDVFDIIERFLKTANLEIMQTRHYIDNNLILKPKSEWDAQVVNQIQQDLIGYYQNLLMQVYSLFSDRTSAINKYNQYRVENNEDAVDLKNFVSQLVKDISGLQQDYNSHVVMPYVKMVLTDYVNQEDAISDKQTFIYNMYKFLEQDSAYGDLAAGEVLVGMASRSKSSVVRIVEKMMRQAESAASRQVLKKGHDLMRLYDKVRPIGSQISPVNWQKRFMEFDRDGIPTRYFVREINYGQFYKDKDEKERQLRIKYGLIVDENGDTVFPENEETTKDDSVYNKYYDELDEWLDKHCERRYKLQYYKDRRRHLSPKAIRAQQQIQRQINLLLDKCRVNDEFVDLSKLTQNELVQLRDLRKRKRDLGSYYTFTDIGGILHVEEKTGDALQIAKEITAWNKYINGKVNYNPDWNAFNAAKRTIEEQFGKDSEEVRNFVRSNTIKRITPEFYDLLKQAIGVGATSKHLEELKARHRQIINALKLNVGYSSQNLSKLGLGLNTDRSGWIELQKIEQEMANERRRLKSAGVKGEKPTDAESLTFEQIARMMPVTVGDRSTKTYLSYLQEQWRAAAASNTNLLNIFNSMFTYNDEKGRTTFLKAFQYLSPVDAQVTVNGRKYNCIETIPGSEYSELDEHSSFVNERFDKNGPSLQAKAVDENGKRLYKSEEYEKLSDNERQFLNALLQTMDESWEMIPKTANREHKLPQVSGRTMSVLSNTLRCQEWQTAIGYTLRKFGTTYAETTDDVSTNADLARRPDGSVVNNIPIRFINDLDNPIVQSTDILGSVMMFYDMACNYHYKSQNLPTLELIKYAVRPQLSGTNQMKDQYSKIENLLDQRYYGKETSFGFDSNEKITPAKQRTIQTTKTIRNLAAVAMLGVNFTTIEVGYADAMISVLCESIAGKYITVEDATWAFAQCVVHTKNALKGLGKPVVDDKLVAAMQYNQLSRSNSEIFSMTDMNKASRFVHQHLLMGGYTLSDYMVNGLVLLATYHHYRLIEDPTKGKKRFFSKSDAINTFTKLGYSEKEAIRLWKKADVTLWDAYDSKKGDFVVKDEYKDIVTKALEDRIMGRVTDRTAMYNGVIPQAEKAKLQQNVFGSFITLMRNFYINTYWDRFKTGGDYVAKDGDHTITWRSEYARDDLGMVNLETGEFEGAVFKDFVRGLYKMTKNVANFIRGGSITKLTGEQRYALVRLTSELVIVGLLGFWMVWSWFFARENDYDDDKENAWTLELFGENKGLHFKTLNMDKKFFNWMRWKMALLSTRTFTERLTPWTPQVAIELFTSPSTATSYLDDIGQFWGLFIDLINGDVDKEIKNGGYKHTSRGTRDILKLFSFTGIDNIVRSWHEDGIKSTANYYRKLSPTTLFIPSQEQWNEEHGLGSHGASGGSSGSGFQEFE